MSSPFDDRLPLELEESVDEPPWLVVVIDTSAIIETKRTIPTDQQWDLFARMLVLVEEGRLTFPGQVAREVARQKHPDMPGAWCAKATKRVQRGDPAEQTLVAILPSIRQLVDDSAEYENEPADPYVVAMAYELARAGYDAVVVTEDRVDRLPLKIAMATACETLGITTWDCETFVAWVGESTSSPS